MAFDGSEGGTIPIATAAAWTANFRATITPASPIIAQYFGEDIIQSILDQSGCVGIRFYYAIDGGGKNTLIMVGVDTDENDMISGIVADFSMPCPTACSSANVLNSNS